MDFYKNIIIQKENFLNSIILESSSNFEKKQDASFYFNRIKRDIVYIRREMFLMEESNKEYILMIPTLIKILNDISFSFASKYGFEDFKKILLSRKYKLREDTVLKPIELINLIDRELLEYYFKERNFLSLKLIPLMINTIFDIQVQYKENI